MVNPQFLAIRRNLQPGYVAFRQRGTLLEYSLDNVSWNVAYDFSGLLGTTINEQSNTYNEWYETVTNNYNGTPQSIAPGLTYDGSWKDAARDKSLCVTIRVALDAFRAAIDTHRQVIAGVENYDEAAAATAQVSGLAAAGAVLSAAGVAIFGISTAGLGWIALGAAAGGAAALGVQFWESQNEDLSHWDNDEALENVACFMYNGLAGQNVTLTRWRALRAQLATYPNPPPGDEIEAATQKLAKNIALIDEKSADFYLALISAASTLVDNSPFAGECECDALWDYTFDFMKRPYSDLVMPERDIHNTLVPLNYIPTKGYAAVTSITGGRSDRGVFMSVNFPGFPASNVATDVTRIDVEYSYTQGFYSTPYLTFSGQMNLRNGTTASQPSFTLATLSISNGINVNSGITGTAPDGNNIYVYIRCGFDKNGGQPGGDVIIRKIRIFGTGTNPFEVLP